MSTQPVDNLEQQAVEQRQQIHATAEELRGKISDVKEKLSVTRNLNEHLFVVSVGIGAAALLMSTIIASRFKR